MDKYLIKKLNLDDHVLAQKELNGAARLGYKVVSSVPSRDNKLVVVLELVAEKEK